MTKSITPNIIVIAGPTASGKSGLALQIAQKTGGVIINADSQQMYRELPILTARPTPDEEALVPHRLYGILSVSQPASAGIWLRHARMEIDWALSQGMQPVVVGGTGLYLKALMQGIADMPDIAPEVRAQAISDYDEMGKDAFAQRLREVDPVFFERLKVQDKQRLIRAYEVWLGSGKPLSWWQQAQGATPPYPATCFEYHQVDIAREELYRRCDERFLKMVEQGAVQEVKAFLDSGFKAEDTVVIGVKEITSFLRGEITLEQSVAMAQQATRNYAKRQLTWLRNQFGTFAACDVSGLIYRFLPNSLDPTGPKH